MKLRYSWVALGLLLTSSHLAIAAAPDGAKLIENNCAACHKQPDGTYSRISGQRKTPEAWQMTIQRMRRQNGLELDANTQRLIVQYLSDTQGLAPSETKDLRYALDRDPAAQEVKFNNQFVEMCGRCHTAARVALQRRTKDEWRTHIDFHVGQFPTIEYQSLGRDRDWYKIAVETMVPLLAEQYPLETEAWTQWKAANKPDPVGSWVVSTSIAGVGPVFGAMTASQKEGVLQLEGNLQSLDGKTYPLKGTVNIYTGYEWRASVSLGEQAYRQILALSEDGKNLEGRHFAKGQDNLSTVFKAAKQGTGTQILAVYPENLKAGKEQEVVVIGAGIDQITTSSAKAIEPLSTMEFGAKVKVASQSVGASVDLKVEESVAKLPVYDKVDRLSIEPPYAVARVGGNGSSTPPANVWFQAVAWLNGADGKPNTEDDIRIGKVNPTWQLKPFNEEAEKLKDAEFVGKMDEKMGLFATAEAGPNPERVYSTNNAGNMKVLADYEGATGEAQMIVTVQRWIDPPLR